LGLLRRRPFVSAATRIGVSTFAAVSRFVQRADVVGDDLRRLALLALVRHVAADLELALHRDEAALLQVVRRELRRLAPCYDVDKVRFLRLAGLPRLGGL